MATKQKNTYGPRRKFKGKRVLASGSPKGHHGQPTTVATAGYTCGDQVAEAVDSKHVAGRFRVSMPKKLTKFGTKAGPIVRD